MGVEHPKKTEIYRITYLSSCVVFSFFLFLVGALAPVPREWRVEKRISCPTLAQLFLFSFLF